MNKGIIYLLQPCELVGTNRYKIGISNKTNLDRCKNGYKSGSRFLCIMECINPLILENKIKNKFNDVFILCAGKEYFKGDETKMIKTFINIVLNHMEKNNDDYYYDDDNSINISSINISNDNSDISDISDGDSDSDSDNIVDINDINDIRNEFTNCKDDVLFGGKKHLIKTIIKNYWDDSFEIKIKYIDKSANFIANEIISGNKNTIEYAHIKKILDKKIIETNQIYDLNDVTFQNKIKKCKTKYDDVILLQQTQKLMNYNLPNNSLFYLFNINSFINNVPCREIKKNKFFIGDGSNQLTICILNKQRYDYLYLREYIPYCISYDNKNFYVENRDYKFIDANKEHVNDVNFSERKWLFKDDITCWTIDNKLNDINFKNIIKKYAEITHNKKYVNFNTHVNKLMLNNK